MRSGERRFAGLLIVALAPSNLAASLDAATKTFASRDRGESDSHHPRAGATTRRLFSRGVKLLLAGNAFALFDGHDLA
jgi:hypothetical protein